MEHLLSSEPRLLKRNRFHGWPPYYQPSRSRFVNGKNNFPYLLRTEGVPKAPSHPGPAVLKQVDGDVAASPRCGSGTPNPLYESRKPPPEGVFHLPNDAKNENQAIFKSQQANRSGGRRVLTAKDRAGKKERVFQNKTRAPKRKERLFAFENDEAQKRNACLQMKHTFRR